MFHSIICTNESSFDPGAARDVCTGEGDGNTAGEDAVDGET